MGKHDINVMDTPKIGEQHIYKKLDNFFDVKASTFGDERSLRSRSHLFDDWVQLAIG
jgi:hypothetical protein